MPAPRQLLGPQPQPTHGTPLLGRGAVLSNYNPSFAERLTDFMARNWYGDNRQGTRKAERLMNAADQFGFGILTGAVDAGQQALQGNAGDAALTLSMAAVPPAFRGPANRLRRSVPSQAALSGLLRSKRAAGGKVSPPAPIDDSPPPTIGHNSAGASPYDLEPGSDPRYLGAAPDRSDFTFLRYTPKKLSARMDRAQQAIMDPQNPVRIQMMKDIELGRNFKGADWYNSEELRDWFIAELGPQQGHAEWRDFLKLMGTNSAGSNVLTNIKTASAVRRNLANNPVLPGSKQTYREAISTRDDIKDFKSIAKARTAMTGEEGYGHRYNGLHEMVTGKAMINNQWDGLPELNMTKLADGSWTMNPKPKGFYNSFTGNTNNIAADLHFTRYMGMASRHPDWLVNGAEVSNAFKNRMLAENPAMAPFFRSKALKATKSAKAKDLPVFDARKAHDAGVFNMDQAVTEPSVWTAMPNDNEYGAMEKLMARIGEETGLTAAQIQASLWMGAAKRTRVHEGSLGTFMELIRARADARAKKTGSTRAEVIRNFIRNKGLLTLGGGTLGYGAMSGGNDAQAAPARIPTVIDAKGQPYYPSK